MAILLAGLVGYTLAVGMSLLVLARRVPWIQRFAQFSALMAACLSLLFLTAATPALGARLPWIDGHESLGLILSRPSSYLATLSFWVLFITQMPRWTDERTSAFAAYWPGLAHLLCGLAVAALTIDQFLGRVVLLDLVSLVTLVVLAAGSTVPINPPILLRYYLIFRLGDVALMFLVATLWVATDTLNITIMLDQAVSLGSGVQMRVTIAALLAIWVKLGLPPAHGWVVRAAGLDKLARSWILASALPVLGVYLLYRVRPLLQSSGIMLPVAFLGLVALLWGLRGVLRGRDVGPGCSVGWLTVHSALGLILSGTGAMRFYLLTFVPLRVGLCLSLGPAAIPALRRSQYPFARLLGLCARRFVDAAAFVERRVLLPPRLKGGLPWLQLAREGVLFLEDGILEGLLRSIDVATGRFATLLQEQHTGRLRRNLLWASGALVGLVTAAMLWLIP